MAKADSGGKRKRNSEASTKPSKKVAIRPPPSVTNVRVSLVPDTEDWAPIVASTPGFAIPSSISLQPYTKRRKNARPRPDHSGAITHKELLLQSSSHPKMDYIGREGEAGSADGLLNHYVGVYDPSTGKLQIMEVRRMYIRGTVRSHEAPPEALTGKDIPMKNMDLRNQLGQTFGTKKARKAILNLTENAITPKNARQNSPGGSQEVRLDSTAIIMLESMAETTANIATREELAAAVDDAKPRPKANLAAENVKDVYTVNDLIGLEIMKLLPVKEWQDAIKADREIVTKSRYVAHRLQRAGEDVQKLKVLRYLLCLLEFFGSSIPRGKGGMRVLPPKEKLKAAIKGVPDPVLEQMRRKFSVDGQMLKYQIDLLITHVCALALLVDNFEVDLYDLREDLHLEVKEISQYFHEIGAKVVAAGKIERKKLGLDKAAAAQHRFAQLRLPLDFPKAKFSRAGRR